MFARAVFHVLTFSSGLAQKRDHKGRPLSPRSKEELRLKVNQRERQRMHDLNMALDALRQVGRGVCVCVCVCVCVFL